MSAHQLKDGRWIWRPPKGKDPDRPTVIARYELCPLNNRNFWYMKWLAENVLSCVGLCLALPLFPFIALLIKLDSRGPIFYSQLRIGRGNVPFRAWKLR